MRLKYSCIMHENRGRLKLKHRLTDDHSRCPGSFFPPGCIKVPSGLDRMHIGSVADWDVFGSMVFWRAHPGSIFISNNLVYSSTYPGGTLAFPIDIPRVYSAGYSYCDL